MVRRSSPAHILRTSNPSSFRLAGICILYGILSRWSKPQSIAAANTVRGYVSRQHRETIAAIKGAPDGLTREQLTDLTGVIVQSCCARVKRTSPAKYPAPKTGAGIVDAIRAKKNSTQRWADI